MFFIQYSVCKHKYIYILGFLIYICNNAQTEKDMKRTVLMISLVVVLLGITVLHYTSYDRKIVKKICNVFNRGGDRPAKTSTTAGDLSAMFDDKNRVHLRSARQLGLKQPLKNRDEAESIKGRLVKIESNKYYKVDRLTHSIPYLTQGAANMLGMIGKNFQDSLKSKDLPSYSIIVTSVLRTKDDVKRLRQSGNPNASINSAHCHATTIDITYARFAKKGRKSAETATLKNVLGEVLRDLKKQKKCYVKYEVRQKCFHITTRI